MQGWVLERVNSRGRGSCVLVLEKSHLLEEGGLTKIEMQTGLSEEAPNKPLQIRIWTSTRHVPSSYMLAMI